MDLQRILNTSNSAKRRINLAAIGLLLLQRKIVAFCSAKVASGLTLASKAPVCAVVLFGMHCLLLCVASDRALAQVNAGQIDQFGDATCTLSLGPQLQQDSPNSNKVDWRIVCANRILAQGKSTLRSTEQCWSFDFATPMVNPGVVLEATLIFRLKDSQSESTSPLRLRSKDSLTHVRQQLTKAGVAIYDSAGDTIAAFKELAMEPKIVTSFSGLPNDSIVIVGEGVAWDYNLVKAVDDWEKGGKFVIVLRPTTSSTWPLRLSGDRFKKINFSQLEPSDWYPTNLDSNFWPNLDRSAGWGARVEESKLVLVPEKGSHIWQLVEYQIKENTGGSLFVGVPLIARWRESPVPRELLTHILVNSLQRKSTVQAVGQK